MADGNFPRPYINNTREDDPIMVRVPFDKTSIGARNQGLPDNWRSSEMTIEHVGMSAQGKR